jgi:hypothetical protein
LFIQDAWVCHWCLWPLVSSLGCISGSIAPPFTCILSRVLLSTDVISTRRPSQHQERRPDPTNQQGLGSGSPRITWLPGLPSPLWQGPGLPRVPCDPAPSLGRSRVGYHHMFWIVKPRCITWFMLSQTCLGRWATPKASITHLV